MAKLTNSSATSYALAARTDFKVHHVKKHYMPPVVCSSNDSSFYSIRLKASTHGVVTYQHFLMFYKFINKFKFLKKRIYLKARVYINSTRKPAEVRMGKGKGKFEEKIAPVSPGTDFLEIRLYRLSSVSLEQWPRVKEGFVKDVFPILAKLAKKLPFKARISFDDL